MTIFGPEIIQWTFLFFCRIGACLMIIPGFSTQRIPVRVRLFIAIAITLAITPLLLTMVENRVPDNTPVGMTLMIVAEIIKGAIIGLMGQMFMLSMQFAASAMAMFIGMGTMPGTPIEGAEPVPSLVALLTLTATVLIFVTDLHHEVIRALLASYEVSGVGELPLMRLQLNELVSKLSTAMFLAMQVSSPFLIYAVIANLSIGLLNKLTPQVPIYFISLPFILLGGLFLLFFVSDEMLQVFMRGYGEWLRNG